MKHWHRWLMAALGPGALVALVLVALRGSLGRDVLAQGSTIYVDADAMGTNDGTSWEDAYTTLQPALEDAMDGDDIWVAAGTYTPTYEFSPGDPRSVTFQLKNGVALYGGFDPTVGDTRWEDRDWVNNVAILSGDIGTQGDPADNSYHVFYHPPELALDGSAVLDGFTVTGGNADNNHGPNYRGGGMYNDSSSPSVTHCTFLDNSAGAIGGGMFNLSSLPVVTNCTFTGNSASHGGGTYNKGSSPTLTNCTFSGNLAQEGAGMFNYYSSPVVTNCTFTGNSASHNGGGMYSESSSPVVTNCTFSGNLAQEGGGMSNATSSPVVTTCTFSGNVGGGMENLNSGSVVTNCTFFGNVGAGMFNGNSSPTVTNCILWGDAPQEILNYYGGSPTVTFSDIQGGYEGTGNIDADPLFVDFGSGDYRLGPGSPCIDAGTNGAPNLPEFDFEGHPRVVDGDGDGTAVIDMGIDEACLIYVDVQAGGADNGTSWEDAHIDLQDALDEATDGAWIWVATGTYGPTYKFSPGDPRSATFQLKNGVGLYGGFDPTMGDVGWEDRDWVSNATVLSGDIGTVGDTGDNSYHVFYHPSDLALDGSAVLDGFTITGGKADADWPHYSGGGMFNDSSSPAVVNCTFSGNWALGFGGGMYNSHSSPAVTACSFSGNSSDYSGGGMSNQNSSPSVTDCTFSGNSAYWGGGMCNEFSSSPAVTNCTFLGNSATGGGGMRNHESSPAVTNCTFSGNSAGIGGGIYSHDDSSPAVTNCTLWGDSPQEIWNQNSQPVVTYSDIQGGYAGTGNIDEDPLFVDPGSGDYHLGPGSPCIDVGTNDAPNLPDYDFEGDPRIMDGDLDGVPIADMGVDEVSGYALYLPLIFRSY